MNLSFRPMKKEDLTAVITIEEAVYPFPWTEDIIYNCIQLGYECWVVEESNNIIGYSIMLIAAGECHILNLCVAKAAQQKGYGAALLDKVIEIARNKTLSRLLLEVRISNQAAYHLYNKKGFTLIGQRKGYYPTFNGREDALVLELLVN